MHILSATVAGKRYRIARGATTQVRAQAAKFASDIGNGEPKRSVEFSQKKLEYASSLAYGKRLPGAVYIFRPRPSDVSPERWSTIRRAEIAARPDPSWNLLKIHTDQFALTFLGYPEFDAEPHPALAEATKINLNTGSVSRTEYRRRPNPPILHRQETFLPSDDPRIPQYAALTKCEEEAGLYRDPSRIGLRVQWLSLLK